jgi:hypothetical protein
MLVLALFLFFPSFTGAADCYNDELRLLDLEVEMLPLKSQVLSLERAAVNARIREADRERTQQNADLEREIRGSYAGASPQWRRHLWSNGSHHRARSRAALPTMRPSWLQPADRLAPMPEEQRARMSCAAPNDCWLNPMP